MKFDLSGDDLAHYNLRDTQLPFERLSKKKSSSKMVYTDFFHTPFYVKGRWAITGCSFKKKNNNKKQRRKMLYLKAIISKLPFQNTCNIKAYGRYEYTNDPKN